jgi:DDE superfamily endonuclease
MSGVFSNQVARKPNRSRYGLNRAPEEAADEKMADVTDLYLQAPALHAAGERVISTDEMTGIQALERQHPTIPMGPGRVERRECEDSRHGTLTLIAHCDVAHGRVVAPSLGPTRTAEDFVAPIARTGASAPTATRGHFVMDNLHMHQSESLVRLVAEYDGLQDDLGQKDKRGVLQAMATRTAFLSEPTPSMVFH